MTVRICLVVTAIAVALTVTSVPGDAQGQVTGRPEDAPCSTCYDGYPPVWDVTDPGKPERREGGDSFYPMPRGPGDGLGDPGFEIDVEVAPAGPAASNPGSPDSPAGDPAAPALVCTPVPPVPPRPSWTAAPLPDPGVVGADPIIKGLTGLESRFWWTGQDTIEWTQTGQPGITADCIPIPAPTATFAARVARWDWDLGETAQSSFQPGAKPSPAVRHTYQTKDPTTVVTVDLLWIGDPPGTVTTLGGRRAHPVIEVRSILTG